MGTSAALNIGDDIEIKQHKKFPSVYGVNMMQGWNTSRYSDEGYLLLVVDFSDDDKPLIHVRTWQPDKVGGKSLAENEKFTAKGVKAAAARARKALQEMSKGIKERRKEITAEKEALATAAK